VLVTLGVIVTVLVLLGTAVRVSARVAVGVLLGPLVGVGVHTWTKLTLHGVAGGEAGDAIHGLPANDSARPPDGVAHQAADLRWPGQSA